MAPLKAWAFCALCLSVSVAKPIHEPQASTFNFEIPKGMRPASFAFNTNDIFHGLPDRSTLRQRNGDHTIWKARPGPVIHPIQAAVTVLDAFYTAIFNEATQVWSLRPPMKSFWVRMGSLELAFDSAGGPIPWDFVAQFAWKLRSATRLGWVGTHGIIYVNSLATHTVVVTLTIVERGMGARKRTLSTALHHSLQETLLSLSSKRALVKRDDVTLTFSKIYGTILPVFLASEKLRDFFIAISHAASSTWTSRPESALFTVTQGPLQLTVSCLGSTLPWEILVVAANRFSDYADRLFANTFDAFYTELASKISIGFSLRVLEGVEGSVTDAAIRLSMPSSRNLAHPPLFGSPASLERRASSSPGLKMTKFSPLKMVALVPSVAAASRLEDFYNILALKIETGFFRNCPPSKSIVLEFFEFELSISCASINVPWSFVQSFLIDMADWSSKQFSGLYEATIRGDGPLTNLVFIVSMRMRQNAPGQPPKRP